MFYSVLTLLVLLLVLRLAFLAARSFWIWLGRGRDLQNAVDHRRLSEQAVAARLRGERLGRTYRQEVHRARALAVEEYLDRMDFGWYQAVFIFVAGSVAGLVLEEVWMFVTAGLTQSRVGLVWGPFSPLYGVGALLLTLLSFCLRRSRATDLQLFLTSVLVGGGLEQLTGWGMQALFDAQSWTYLGLPDHITQWVAWRFLLMWGLLGLVWAKHVMPELLYLVGEPLTHRQVAFVVMLAIYLSLDVFMTVSSFQRRAAREAGAPAHNGFERWIDEHYTDEFMANRFQNLVVGHDLMDEGNAR